MVLLLRDRLNDFLSTSSYFRWPYRLQDIASSFVFNIQLILNKRDIVGSTLITRYNELKIVEFVNVRK